jgi:hypothetical protein
MASYAGAINDKGSDSLFSLFETETNGQVPQLSGYNRIYLHQNPAEAS